MFVMSHHKQNNHHKALRERTRQIYQRVAHLYKVLNALHKLGMQMTWLGSRKLGPGTPEYEWSAAVGQIIASWGIYQKTGGGPGIMEAPLRGCHDAGRPELGVAVRAQFLDEVEPVNPYANPALVFNLSDFNERHEALFLGSSFFVVLPGRLGTLHELFDLLNRIKHSLLHSPEGCQQPPVYVVERSGFWTYKLGFLTTACEEVGVRVSPSDFNCLRIVDMSQVSPQQFTDMVRKDLGLDGEGAGNA